jgi:hypothetical protein
MYAPIRMFDLVMEIEEEKERQKALRTIEKFVSEMYREEREAVYGEFRFVDLGEGG